MLGTMGNSCAINSFGAAALSQRCRLENVPDAAYDAGHAWMNMTMLPEQFSSWGAALLAGGCHGLA